MIFRLNDALAGFPSSWRLETAEKQLLLRLSRSPDHSAHASGPLHLLLTVGRVPAISHRERGGPPACPLDPVAPVPSHGADLEANVAWEGPVAGCCESDFSSLCGEAEFAVDFGFDSNPFAFEQMRICGSSGSDARTISLGSKNPTRF